MDETLKAGLVERVRRAFPETVAVYAHGSLVRGTARPDSDLDLAVLLPRGQRPAARAWIELASDLDELAQRKVDLGFLQPERSIVYCKEVLAHGERWAAFDERAAAEFEMYALAEYADYRRALAPVIAAYTAGAGGG
ncbi:MAG: type VII toxin-antitoxin system MntA family adenylyltransferase antitoxin [Myxococcales bacterium]